MNAKTPRATAPSSPFCCPLNRQRGRPAKQVFDPLGLAMADACNSAPIHPLPKRGAWPKLPLSRLHKGRRMFKEIKSKVEFPRLEEEALQLWEREAIFQKSISQQDPQNRFFFYDGPPFATG